MQTDSGRCDGSRTPGRRCTVIWMMTVLVKPVELYFPCAVYSSVAPQECINIHNSDHLAMGTTGVSPQRSVAASSLSSQGSCSVLLVAHSLISDPLLMFNIHINSHIFQKAHSLSVHSYTTLQTTAHTCPKPFVFSSPGRQRSFGSKMSNCLKINK